MNFLLTEGGTSGRRIITNSFYSCEHYNTHIPLIPHSLHLPLPPSYSPFPSLTLLHQYYASYSINFSRNSHPNIIQRNRIINTTKWEKPIDKLLILWYNIIEKEAMPNERVKTPTKCVNKKLCQDPIYRYYIYRVWVQFLRQ